MTYTETGEVYIEDMGVIVKYRYETYTGDHFRPASENLHVLWVRQALSYELMDDEIFQDYDIEKIEMAIMEDLRYGN
jgi:hypothetical protein